jgi:putative ABC transport system permease protein
LVRLILGQLRLARGRTAVLAAGLLVAAVSFILLTSAVTTSELRVRGRVAHNFRAAYDVLVRPAGSFSQVERERGLVQQNYLGGIFGGITMDQYQAVRTVPGVEVAAPIANLGYVPLRTTIQVPLDHLLGGGRQVYRVRWTWVANGGASRYPATDGYLYLTPNQLATRAVSRPSPANPAGLPLWYELVPGRGRVRACSAGYVHNPEAARLWSPYDRATAPGLECASIARPAAPGMPGRVVATLTASPPMLLAAIDPEQEAKLVGLDRAVVAGRFLQQAEAAGTPPVAPESGPPAARQVPVLLSVRTYVDQALEAAIQRLTVPAASLPERLESRDVWRYLRQRPAQQVGRRVIPADAIHRQVLRDYGGAGARPGVIRWAAKYTQASAVTYRPSGGRLEARTVPGIEREGRRDWARATRLLGYVPAEGQPQPADLELLRSLAPPGIEDVRYRRLIDYLGARYAEEGAIELASLHVVGQFDPARLPGFSPLSQVPLETYHPPEAEPADPPSRKALGGRPLRPTFNVGGYVAQPPFMLTTLEAMDPLLDPAAYQRPDGPGDLSQAPISVIRVRVAGVSGSDPTSRERIRRVAETITRRTGLAVDVTAGSSPEPQLVGLAGGRFGQPTLLVREGWVRKGVAVVVLRAIDRKSLALLGLILITCGTFLVNGGLAAVRSRRRELGVLRCLGWPPWRLFAVVLGELVLVGAAAGAAGVLLAAALAAGLGLDLPGATLLLVAPVALGLAALAGLPPAWRAARGTPLDAVEQRPLIGARTRRVRGLGTMTLGNLARLPGRTLLGAAGVAVGVAALCVLAAINRAFRGTVAGTLLGDALAAQVRPVDYASVALAIVLGAVAVADVVFLNLRERAPELLTLSAAGWGDGRLRWLLGLEGAGTGVLGSVLGSAVGLAVAGRIPGADAGDLVAATVGAGLAGVAAVLASLLVAGPLLLRLPPPTVLGEE